MMEFFIENLVLSTPPSASAQTAPKPPARQANAELATFPSAWTYRPGAKAPAFPHGMVVSNCALATEAGVEILEAGRQRRRRRGGRRVRARRRLPGGRQHRRRRLRRASAWARPTSALDFRETAPAAASRNMFIGPDGKPTDDSLVGHRASGVPGSVAGLLALLEKHGTLPRARVMAPAIRLARDGFIVDPIFNASVAQNADAHREVRRGRPVPARRPRRRRRARRFVQADLARTLQAIADRAPTGSTRGRSPRRSRPKCGAARHDHRRGPGGLPPGLAHAARRQLPRPADHRDAAVVVGRSHGDRDAEHPRDVAGRRAVEQRAGAAPAGLRVPARLRRPERHAGRPRVRQDAARDADEQGLRAEAARRDPRGQGHADLLAQARSPAKGPTPPTTRSSIAHGNAVVDHDDHQQPLRVRRLGARRRLLPEQRDGRLRGAARHAEPVRPRAGRGQRDRPGQADALGDGADDRARLRRQGADARRRPRRPAHHHAPSSRRS